MIGGMAELRTRADTDAIKRRAYAIGFAVGLIGIVFFIAAGFITVIHPEPTLTDGSVALIEGVAERSLMPDPANERPEYELVVSGEPIPSRLIAMHQNPAVLERVASIEPGKTRVVVGVPAIEMAKPRRNRARGEDFRLMCFLRIDGEVAYSLEDYNLAEKKNRDLGMIFFPVMLLLAVFLVAYTGAKLFRKKES